jgi:glutaredoxin
MTKLLLSITLLFLASNAQSAAFYRSIDENGNVQYSDVPQKNAADVEKLNTSGQPADEDTMPFETRRANSKFPVTLYVADNCGTGCTQGREYLKKRGIPYTEKKLVTPAEIETFKKDSGSDQVPVMHIGNDWLTGYLELSWSQALDAAGYPKNAPYNAHIPVKTDSPAEKPKAP